MRYLSPLRYPGGKGRLAPYIARLLASQAPRPHAYAEPFAGGAGAALRLLVDEEVRAIYINDLNPGIAAFWRCVFEQTDAFAALIEAAPVDLDAWHAARAVYEQPEGHDDLELGFATFFLNRCNRSGILGARPIGGLDQAGRWKIDARFNRDNLAERVRLLGGYRERAHVSQLDARDFLRTLEAQGTDVLVYVDPPYLVQGEDLYLDSLRPDDHAELAAMLRDSRLPWFLTYDVHEQITTGLYGGLRTAEFDIAHTAQKQHVGAEYAVFSDELIVPGIDLMRRGESRWIGSAAPA
ncbi:DNA adenine methylase [Modestobacter muralis]|uniref:site-specific DNA-methyltransferase (adenine-specific) n=1 Tax=Modestobacter muralis TaxID=1608614 RepID=A0A6P0EXX9_9ACTN|nr:DNA adenine methylase [Modestobacter muralis]NEK96532.1 DNA adenine methylase [Modestobacter muralis]NEN53432.1 DNA adenine methylase [Modestobacter muralis]